MLLNLTRISKYINRSWRIILEKIMAIHPQTGERLRKVRYDKVPANALFYDIGMKNQFLNHEDGAENLMGCVGRIVSVRSNLQVYLVTKKPNK